jgi:glycosyltransferase involved in cell wall biosynthesis
MKAADHRKPMVSVVIPCRNEKDYIETCLRSILAQEPPPGGFEVIAVDGMSDDGARDILSRLAVTDSRLRIIDNPNRTTPCGINAGIREARGRYVAIMGAHTRYAQDYLLRCVEMLEENPGICCAGGPIVSEGKSTFGQAIAAAMSHPIGIGNAKHRLPNYEGYAEGACFPMFRKEIFDTVGLYDESLVRNQDDDFNYRVARAGGKIFISPSASCSYYVREAPTRLFAQYFQYGYWRVAVLRKHRLPASIRQLIPIMFFLLMFVLFVAGLYLPGQWRLTAAALPLMYASILILTGLGIAKKRGILVGLTFPAAAATMHFAYAVGCVWGVINGRNINVTNAPSSYQGGSYGSQPRRGEIL